MYHLPGDAEATGPSWGVVMEICAMSGWLLQKLSELSSSDGSTVDIRQMRERGESLDFELEESMDPEACFPDGEQVVDCQNYQSDSVARYYFISG